MNCVEVQENLFADCQEWHLRLRNIQIRAVPSSKRVDLFMHTNRVFRFAKFSNLGIAVMKEIRFADTQESCFETWKSSHMRCAALLCGLFDDAQKSHYSDCETFKCGQSRHERTSIC